MHGHIEKSGSEWYISSMLCSWDIPFWSRTLDICLYTYIGVRVWASLLYEYGQSCYYIYIYLYMFWCMYIYMYRHVYVYEYDCFIYVLMCIYCVYMYFMTMYSAVTILCRTGLYELDLLLLLLLSACIFFCFAWPAHYKHPCVRGRNELESVPSVIVQVSF